MPLPLIAGILISGAATAFMGKIASDRQKKRDNKEIRAREEADMVQARLKASRIRLLYGAAGLSTDEGTPESQANMEFQLVQEKYGIIRLGAKNKTAERNDAIIADMASGLVNMIGPKRK